MNSKKYNSPDDLYFMSKNKIRDMILNKNDNVDNNDISICTYNILVPYQIYSKKYANEKKETSVLWFYRWELIKRELDIYNPDIICFQEVQNDLFYRDLLPYFLTQKYMGYFVAMEPLPNDISKYSYYTYDNSVGIAIFFKTKKFRLIHIESFNYHNDVLEYYNDNDKSMLSNNEFKKKINSPFANLSILLEDLRNQKRFIVSNVHLVSKPSLDDVKLLMVYLLLKKINKLSLNNLIPIILCGDFNSIPDSKLYKAITTGKNNYQENESKLIEPIINLPTKYTNLPLSSTFFTIFNKEPKYTNYTPDFKETLDYIFINDKCKVIGQLDEIDLSEYIRIPNSNFPSDHILQMSIIRLS